MIVTTSPGCDGVEFIVVWVVVWHVTFGERLLNGVAIFCDVRKHFYAG